MGHAPLRDRFEAKIERIPESTCWHWVGCTHKTSGYGGMMVAGQKVPAHRVAYELFVGPIPEGLDIDHLCRNRACVNPAHLEAVTRRTNVIRGHGWAGRHARKTTCDNGHKLVPLRNTGRRYCPECFGPEWRRTYMAEYMTRPGSREKAREYTRTYRQRQARMDAA